MTWDRLVKVCRALEVKMEDGERTGALLPELTAALNALPFDPPEPHQRGLTSDEAMIAHLTALLREAFPYVNDPKPGGHGDGPMRTSLAERIQRRVFSDCENRIGPTSFIECNKCEGRNECREAGRCFLVFAAQEASND